MSVIVPPFSFEIIAGEPLPQDAGHMLRTLGRIEWRVGFAYASGITRGCRVTDDATGLDFRWKPVR